MRVCIGSFASIPLLEVSECQMVNARAGFRRFGSVRLGVASDTLKNAKRPMNTGVLTL